MGQMESKLISCGWKNIRNTVLKTDGKSQREYYLNEQMKAIQKELARWMTLRRIRDLKKKDRRVKNAPQAREKTEQELQKLKMMSLLCWSNST